MNLTELLLGQLPEAIYFALFMIMTKQLKTKRILFIILVILEYLLSINVVPYSVWCHITFITLVYIVLKMLYKEKSQITDIFLLGIASVWLIISSVLPAILTNVASYTVCGIVARICLFSIFIFYKKLPKLQNIYKNLWNRKDNTNSTMKSTTFRSINVVLFNIMFYVINLGMLYCLYNNI